MVRSSFIPLATYPSSRLPPRYPRARALGGSTVHNAVVNVVGNLRRDFANFEQMFGSSWSLDSVWEYFKLIERNLYIPNSTEHGYNGWLATKGLDEAILARFPGESPRLTPFSAVTN